MNASLTSKYLQIQGVAQTFRTAKGDFPALRDIDLTVGKASSSPSSATRVVASPPCST